MFGQRFFGRFFGARYFGKGSDVPVNAEVSEFMTYTVATGMTFTVSADRRMYIVGPDERTFSVLRSL